MDSKTELKSESENDLKLKDPNDKDISNDNEPINKKLKLHKNEESEDEDCEFIDSTEEGDIPEEGFIYPLELDASDMLDEVEFDGEYFPSVTERYFTPYYQIDVQKPGDDICIRIHSNRICMITLAPSHTIFQENKTIKSCNFKVSDKLDRMQNKVSGKSKHGAQPMQSNSNLCFLTCTDDSTYAVKCCMIGKLIEINERLIENPELLKEEPHFGGYIAIVLPNLKHLDKTRDKMLTQELYEEAIKKRNENKQQIIIDTEIITKKDDANVNALIDTKNIKVNIENGKEQMDCTEINEKKQSKDYIVNMEIMES